jgi:polar amino acid transport system substrate-binding protein
MGGRFASIMKQVYQDPRARSIEIADLPEPALRPGTLLVRNAFSVVSPGTERSAVRMASESYLATARARPDLVRRVIDTVRREGVLAAYRKVQARLGDLQPLGYSSAGTVVAVGRGAGDYFRIGDRVACAGAGHASHAEVVCVPVNLAARVPMEVPLDAAAFATLGAIALHGVRQAAPTLGERFAVIGLGVMGLLTVQILRASGVRVVSFDLDPGLEKRALDLGAESGGHGSVEDQVSAAMAWTEGVGVDGVIVTAGSKDDSPMVAAAGMCRDRARVVAVGLVPFGLPRDLAYAKELELKIARSYGPGRYDNAFEEKGHDYPIGHVRWTETRNLEAFLHLLAEGRVTPLRLVTHQYPIEEARRAYDDLLSSDGPAPLGMLISYPQPQAVVTPPEPAHPRVERAVLPVVPALAPGQDVEIGFIGAGSFARATLLPIIKSMKGVHLRRVATAHGLTALDAQKRFGFESIGTDADEVLHDPAIHLVCIVTRHDQHADLVVRALRAGKHVFVEKPLALNEAELVEIEKAAADAPGILMVGFNRRFSPHARAMRQVFEHRGPLMMNYRVNAGPLPAGHWLNDPDVGGGRVVGEACHFIDLMSYLTGDSEIVSVQPTALRSRALQDFYVDLTFSNGSLGHLSYICRGSSRLPKELLEVHGNGASAVLDDYRRCVLYDEHRLRRVRTAGKGHWQEIESLLDAIRKGRMGPTSLGCMLAITRQTLMIGQRLSSAIQSTGEL